jgi:hypothetical protein
MNTVLAATTTATIFAAGSLVGCGETTQQNQDWGCGFENNTMTATIQAEDTAILGLAGQIYLRHQSMPRVYAYDTGQTKNYLGQEYGLRQGGVAVFSYHSNNENKIGRPDPTHADNIELAEYADPQQRDVLYDIHFTRDVCKEWTVTWKSKQLYALAGDYYTVPLPPNVSSTSAQGQQIKDTMMQRIVADAGRLAAMRPSDNLITDLAQPVN